MTYLAIDLEMTGLHPKTDRILEIGALRMENGEKKDEFHALINPHCAIPQEITGLTGITQQMADGGEELSIVLPRFLVFCGELPLLGHNLSFDYAFLKQACVNADTPFERSGIDTLRIARHFLPAGQKKKLSALCELFSIDTGAVHRALADAYAAALVYERLYADYYEKEPTVFAPVPLKLNIKKQQPITIPQKEQLLRLLPEHPSADLTPDAVTHLTRAEASRLLERLLHPVRS